MKLIISEYGTINYQKKINYNQICSGEYIANDEAISSYHDIADQMRVGNQFLLEEFNVVPKTVYSLLIILLVIMLEDNNFGNIYYLVDMFQNPK